VSVSPYASISSIRPLLLSHSAVVLMDEEDYIGVLSFRDIAQKTKLLAIDCMSKKPALDYHYSIEDACNLMFTSRQEALPVFLKDKFTGILTKNRLFSGLSEIYKFGKEPEIKSVLRLLGIKESSEKDNVALLSKFTLNQNKLIRALSHDLRSPIARVKGLMEIIEVEEDIVQKMQFCSLISANIDKLSNLVEDLFLVSLEGNLERELALEDYNIYNILLEQFEDYKFDAAKKSIDLVIESKVFNQLVRVDKSEFIRVLDNIIGNAIKFTEKGGKIIIRLYKSDDSTTCLSIKDEGIGIPEKDIANIFTPFIGHNRKGTENERSNGLGLSIVKRILDKMQVDVAVLSKEGKGTEILLRFMRFNGIEKLSSLN